MLTPTQLGVYALETRDVCFVKAMLSLANKQLKKTWVLSHETAADVVLVDVDTQAGQTFWETREDKVKLIAFSAQPHTVNNAFWFLQKPAANIEALINLLKQLQEKILDAVQSPTPAPGITPYAVPGSFASRFHQELFAQQPYSCTVEGFPSFFVDPAAGVYYAQDACSKLVLDLCGALGGKDEKRFNIEPITPEALEAAIGRQQLSANPLQPLVWRITLCSSHGRLPCNVTRDTQLRLTKWPNFTRLPHQKEYVQLAAFFSKRHVTINMAVNELNLEAAKVIDFCNACIALKLMKVEAQVVQQPSGVKRSTLTPENQHLFKRLMSVLLR